MSSKIRKSISTLFLCLFFFGLFGQEEIKQAISDLNASNALFKKKDAFFKSTYNNQTEYHFDEKSMQLIISKRHYIKKSNSYRLVNYEIPFCKIDSILLRTEEKGEYVTLVLDLAGAGFYSETSQRENEAFFEQTVFDLPLAYVKEQIDIAPMLASLRQHIKALKSSLHKGKSTTFFLECVAKECAQKLEIERQQKRNLALKKAKNNLYEEQRRAIQARKTYERRRDSMQVVSKNYFQKILKGEIEADEKLVNEYLYDLDGSEFKKMLKEEQLPIQQRDMAMLNYQIYHLNHGTFIVAEPSWDESGLTHMEMAQKEYERKTKGLENKNQPRQFSMLTANMQRALKALSQYETALDVDLKEMLSEGFYSFESFQRIFPYLNEKQQEKLRTEKECILDYTTVLNECKHLFMTDEIELLKKYVSNENAVLNKGDHSLSGFCEIQKNESILDEEYLEKFNWIIHYKHASKSNQNYLIEYQFKMDRTRKVYTLYNIKRSYSRNGIMLNRYGP